MIFTAEYKNTSGSLYTVNVQKSFEHNDNLTKKKLKHQGGNVETFFHTICFM